MKFKTLINTMLANITGYRIVRTETSLYITKQPKDKTRLSTLRAKEIFKDKPLRVIEVGVFAGENVKNILENLNVKEFIAIDPFAYYGDFYGYEQKVLTEAKVRFRKLMQKYPQIKHIEKHSSNAIKEIEGKFDFIYIDGNHQYKFVKEELENYYQLLNKEGILAGHDIFLFDVLRAFIEFAKEKNISNFEIGRGKDHITYPDWIIYNNNKNTKK